MAGCGSKKMAKGGMVKKVRGYAEGGSVNKMRSESTEAAKAGRSAKDAVSKLIDAESAAEKAQYLARNIGGEDYSSNARVTKALAKSAQRNKDLAADEAERVSKETGYSSLIGRTRSPIDGSQERLDESPVGIEGGRLKYAKGGLVKKPAKGKMAKGGLMVSPRKKMAMGMKMGGAVKKYAKGGMAKKGCK